MEVPAAVVEEWIQRGQIPRAHAMAATWVLPSGLSLEGIEDWVTGLRSSDRLVAVDGSRVEDQESVVRVLMDGLRRRQEAITGTWVRQEGQELRLVQVRISLPLLRAPGATEVAP